MHIRLGLLSLMLTVVLAQTSVSAQQPIAASVQITFAGVQLQRANTQDWLPLPINAQAPFGVGDILRTDKTGRALIAFASASQTLLLPGSEYQLTRFEQTNQQQVKIALRLLKGRSIQWISNESMIAGYTLDLQHMTLTQPTKLFAAQVQPDNASDVIVAQGSLVVSKSNSKLNLQAGSGIRAMDQLGEVISITPPDGFSFLTVTSKTCRGIANATIPGAESVAVRIGPGEDYLNLGNIPNGSKIAIVGKADTGKRYLTPFLSSFGWVIANGINVESCDTIPIVPAEKQPINGVTNPLPFEMDFLTPFFGMPIQNVHFYIYQ
ncbi:MAG: hypothetical protein GC179_23260 [Anaerolineaceae bacterium]|nr:hypothetical protein [Anaerolineaceae bacterium]